MRLHRDDEPTPDEPEGEWVEAASAAPSGTLADFLGTWTVVRRWREVKARSAAEAIEATRGEVIVDEHGYQVVLGHDSVQVSRGELVMLYHSRVELEALLSAVAPLLTLLRGSLELDDVDEAMKATLRPRVVMLNSLQTQLSEALEDFRRYDDTR